MKLMMSHPCGKNRDLREFSCAEDGNTEEWRQDGYDKNSADSCILIGEARFRFIKIFWWILSGGQVVGIQSNDKHKCNYRGNCFVVTILSNNIKITWVGGKQIIVAKAAD